MKTLLAFLILFLSTTSSYAQTAVRQSGTVTPGHVPIWTTNGIIQDGGTAFQGFLTSLGVTAQGAGICQNSAPVTQPYNRLCLGVNTASAAFVSLQNLGGATAQTLEFIINGTVYTFPFIAPGTGVLGPSTTVIGDLAIWNNTLGTLLASGGPPNGVSVMSNTSVLCDGATDDTTGIQAVITSNAGKLIYTPPGRTCRVTGITVPASTTLQLTTNSTLKKFATGGQKIITVSGNNVSILGPGTLDGNNDTTFAANGIFCQNHSGLTIDGVTFQNISYSHINNVNCVTRFTLKNSNLLGGDSVDALGSLFLAPTADSEDAVIHNNLCDRQGSIGATGQVCFNVVGDGSSIIRRLSFTNNRCVGVSGSGTIFQSCLQNINMAQADSIDGAVIANNQARYCNYCFTFDTLTNSSVTGNTARDVFSAGYTYEASSCVNTTFTGNTAEGTMNSPGVMALINVANGCIFSGNTFKNASVDASATTISFNATAPKGATNIVSNNTVIIAGGTGIGATNNDSVISGNAVRGGATCINLSGGTNRTVTGNICVGQSGTPIINADATDVICANNALGCNPLKLRVAGGTPALTTCGTSPAIVGSDMSGEITMGTGTPTGCVITFNVAYGTAPLCTVTWQATPLASQSYAVSSTAITLTQTATSSNKANYTCVARIGG